MLKLPKMTPHTAAKHLLLRRYLDRWFPILGRTEKSINYIDGFAGPGEYQAREVGSPHIAIEAAKAHVERGSLAPDVEIDFTFVEADPDSAENLKARLAPIVLPPSFRVSVIPGEFATVIGAELDQIERAGLALAPTFAFVDPFGFSGIPFDLMGRILRYPKCEVFVNVMVEFINRFLEHPNDRIVAHFPVTFGTDEVREIPRRMGDREKAILSLYRTQLARLAKYVGRFDMHGRRDQKTYTLFFASNHPRGFEKMKESMWSVDRAEGSRFSAADPGESYAFELFPFWPLWDQLLARFAGQRVLMAELERFVEETDFLPTHARTILKECERKGDVSAEAVPGYRRPAGTFKSDKVNIKLPGVGCGLELFSAASLATRLAIPEATGNRLQASPNRGICRTRSPSGHSAQSPAWSSANVIRRPSSTT
jgi:three-Cys-motif partner protein